MSVRAWRYWGATVLVVLLGYVVLPTATARMAVALGAFGESVVQLWAVWQVVLLPYAVLVTVVAAVVLWCALPRRPTGRVPRVTEVTLSLTAGLVLLGPTCVGLLLVLALG